MNPEQDNAGKSIPTHVIARLKTKGKGENPENSRRYVISCIGKTNSNHGGSITETTGSREKILRVFTEGNCQQKYPLFSENNLQE